MLEPNEWLAVVVKNAGPIKRPSWIGNMKASFENGEWNLKTISLFLLTYHSHVMPAKPCTDRFLSNGTWRIGVSTCYV